MDNFRRQSPLNAEAEPYVPGPTIIEPSHLSALEFPTDGFMPLVDTPDIEARLARLERAHHALCTELQKVQRENQNLRHDVDTLDLWLKKVLDFFMTKFGEIGRDAPTTVNFSSTSASMPETGVQVLSSVDPLWSHLANQPMISDHFGDLDPGFGESSFPESGPGSFEY